MTEQQPRRPWRIVVRRGVAGSRDALSEVARWKTVEVDTLRLLAAGLSVALPVAIGELAGNLGAGMTAALGALLMSSSGQAGSARRRVIDLLNTLVVGFFGMLIGAWSAGLGAFASSVVIVAVASMAVVLGGIRGSAAKVTTLAIVFMIIGASLGLHIETRSLATYSVLGGLGAAILTMLTFAVTYHLLGKQAAAVAPSVPLADDLRQWAARLKTVAGWHYPARLISSMIVAELIAHQLHGTHSYWIVLTVALVVQRDHTSALTHSLQRGLGTALGVLLGGLFLASIPIWVMIAVIGAIAASRPYLRAANYTAYAMVMTPLVAVFTGLGATMTAGVLVERLLDTVIGCVISLTVGYALWRWMGPDAA
ncbi:FUSC family protein [Nocardia sp. NPDC058640]|uniref:FUSC family protein n=1 Tax=Nocardia sp. NPDC058640 TaxID=3346571 RepID=UPI0036494725